MAPGIYLSGRLHHVRNFQYRLEKLICTACVTQQRTSRDNILELSAPRGLSTSNISLHKWILFICMLEHICFWTLGIFWSGVITILLSCISYERRKSNTNIIDQYRTFDPSHYSINSSDEKDFVFFSELLWPVFEKLECSKTKLLFDKKWYLCLAV